MVWMLALAVLVPRGNAAPAPDLWPLAVKGLPASELEHRCAAIEAAAVSLPSWTWPAVQLAADNATSVFLVGPAMQEQVERGRVGRGRAVALSAALAAGCVAAVGVL